MFYSVYKITNNINNKIYIGIHRTTNLLDGYMGSSKPLKSAFKKYGKENFSKEILFLCRSEQEMLDRERHLVTENFIKRKDTYNLNKGGEGSFFYFNNKLKEDSILFEGVARKRTEGQKRFYDSKEGQIYLQNVHENFGPNRNTFEGRKHSPESIELMKNRKRGHGSGSANSQFGSIWITNGIENRKLRKDMPMPDNWRPGRI